jgi:uncharacterized protein
MKLIDACAHVAWKSQDDVVSYMSRGWQEYVGHAGFLPDGGGAIPLTSSHPYRNPAGERLESAYGKSERPGASMAELQNRLLDANDIEKAVIVPEQLLLAPTLPNLHLAEEVCRAANDWTIDHWLSGEEARLYGLVLVANQSPDLAAAEIRRVGRHERMAGVLMGGNGLGRPFGHPVYHAIYDAAAELGLPIVVHAGGDVSTDAMARPNAGGPVATYAEYHMLQAHSLMTHCVSMIGQGVFTKHPGLRLLLVGGGVTWIPSLIWRFDTEYRGMGPRDATWLTDLPGRYFHRHVRVSAYPFDSAPGNPDAIRRLLSAMPELADVICYASGFPNWDTVSPSEVREALPAGWEDQVMHGNANSFYRWSPMPLGPDGERRVKEAGTP